MILTIRTDNKDAELGLYDDSLQLAYRKWFAHRELSTSIHRVTEELLSSLGKDWRDITAVAMYKGPGSFTGLRIGLTYGNTLARSLGAPVVGATGDDWIERAVELIAAGKTDAVVMPDYGAEAHITLPKK